MAETKTKLKHFVARIEWHNTAWVDVAISAPTLEEACKLAFEDADYDSQRTYDDSGDSFISKIAPCGTREAAEDCEQRGNLWDREGLAIPAAHRDPLDCAIDERDELRAALAALDKWSTDHCATKGGYDSREWDDARALLAKVQP